MAHTKRKKMQGFSATKPTQAQQNQTSPELGFTGTVILSGFIIGEDYNPDLAGKKGLETWDMMRRNDATVSGALKAVKYPIMGADWFMEPASDDPEDILIRDAVQFVLFEDCDTSFFELLRQALSMLDYGFQPFELVYKTTQFIQQVEVTEQDDATGESPVDDAQEQAHAPVKSIKADDAGMPPAPGTVPPPSAIPPPKMKEMPPITIIGLAKIAYRKPLSVYKWIDENGNPGITQRARDGRMAFIPMDKLVIFINDREGDNFEGISILRPAYKHWYIKDSLYKIDAMKHERQGLGVPKIKMPNNATATDKAAAQEILSNLRANEGGYLSVPQNFDVEFLDMKAHGTSDMQESIQHHDRQIMFNVLAAFLELGATKGSGGGNATSQDHQKLFQQSLEAIAKNFKETVDKYIIRRLVDLNWPGSHYPRLRYEKISDYNLLEFGQAVSLLANAGVLTKDKTLEASTRNVYNMPELPDNPEYTQPLNTLPPYVGDTSTDPSDNAQEEQSQNLDKRRYPSQNGSGAVTLKASEQLIQDARNLKAAIDRNLEQL